LDDALVIGGEEDLIELRALPAAFPNVLDQRFPRDEMQRLPGEARRASASWENTKDMWFE